MIDFEIGIYEMGLQYARLLNPKVDFNTPYTFYYDETNNIKKFYVKEGGFNVAFTANFVLGGLVHDREKPDIESLIKSFKLQNNVNEVKFKHIASGEFQDCLKSQKLKLYLQYILESNIYIHYSSINILYWSLVDIVDSAIFKSKIAKELGPDFGNYLKNILYKLAKLEINSVIDLFYRFDYPNIKADSIFSFIESLNNLFQPYIEDPEFHFGLESLRQILKEVAKKGQLPFVMNETDHILISRLSDFYLRPIWSFKSSTHVFDNEEEIKSILSEYRILDNGNEINTYSFVDSVDNKLIQLSDIFVGLMGKFTNYINTRNIKEIESNIHSFNEIQIENLKLLYSIIEKSNTKNPAFIHRIESFEDVSKFEKIIYFL